MPGVPPPTTNEASRSIMNVFSVCTVRLPGASAFAAEGSLLKARRRLFIRTPVPGTTKREPQFENTLWMIATA